MLRKRSKSFYDWCIENGKENYLELWDYDKNNISPKDISHKTKKYYYFKCKKNIHESFQKGISNLVFSKDCICPQCNSFYQWCIENKRQDLIEAWDKSLNDDIHYISKCTAKKYWFKFELYSYFYPIQYITNPNKNQDPYKKYINSFGYYLIKNFGNNAINDYWSKKNSKSPFEFDKCSGKKVYIKCQEKNYHEDYLISPDNFYRGERCPACVSKIVYKEDSFAQYNINKYGEDWLDKYWCDDNTIDPFKISKSTNDVKVHLKCQRVEYHNFYTHPNNYYSADAPCPYCSRKLIHPLDSLGSQVPEILDIWSDKNDKTPFDYAYSSKEKVWLKCRAGKHNDYMQTISDYSANHSRNCIYCVRERKESFLEEKVRLYLETFGYTVLHEYNCSIIPINPISGYKMPFDNEIKELKIIIEVHGIQHYELCGWHITQSKKSGKTPEEEFKYQKWKDNQKKNFAINNGYNYIEIPYWSVKDDTYKNIINKEITRILNQESLETAGIA
jgi:hypothetical protein